MSVLITAKYLDGQLQRQISTILPQLDSSNQGEIVLSLDPSCSMSIQTVKEVLGGGDRLVVRHAHSSGIPAGRNACVESARNEYFLFCDSDDVVSPTWVWDHLNVLDTEVVSCGEVELVASDGKVVALLNQPLTEPYDFLPFWLTANLGVSREATLSVKGFDVSISHGEDVDFTWRLQVAGYSMCPSSARVLKSLRSTQRSRLRQHFNFGRGDAVLYAKHKTSGMRRTSVVPGICKAFVLCILKPRDIRRRHQLTLVLWRGLGRVVGSAQSKVLFV